MNKKHITILAIIALTLTIVTPAAYAKKPETTGPPEKTDKEKHGQKFFQELQLMYSSDTLPWEEVPGSQSSGYKLKLNGDSEEYYYLDIMTMITREPLPDGMYPIYIEEAPPGFIEWWDSEKGVDSLDVGTWEEVMYDIITGEAPICYLKVTDGTGSLVDGLLLQYATTENVFRLNGDYYLGEYGLRLELSETHNEYFSMLFKAENQANNRYENREHHGDKVIHLYLYEKDPSTWNLVEDGAWGKLTAMTHQDMFVFNGHALTEGDMYSLIYYPDPWPGNGLMVLGTGTVNPDGNIHIMGNFDFGHIPIVGDENSEEGAKIWLVLSSDIAADEYMMQGWTPEKYLFENNLIL